MLAQKLTDPQILEQIESDVRREIAAAVQFALDAPFPKPEEVDPHVFA